MSIPGTSARSRAISMGLAGLLLMSASTARAQPNRAAAPETTGSSRLFLAASPHVSFGSVEIDGTSSDEGGSGLGVTGGYSHVLKPRWLLLLGVLRYGAWSSTWSKAAGESRRRADAGVGPQVYLPLTSDRLSLYFALPVGGTMAWIEPGPHRAIAESYDTGHGFHAAATAGLAWHPASLRVAALGLIVEGSYLMHSVWFTHRAETLAPPIRSAEETYRFSSRAIVLSVGLEAWL